MKNLCCSSSVGRCVCRAWCGLVCGLKMLKAPASLLARIYVARVFFLSGLTKINDWDKTLALFKDIYQVPLLPPAIAPYLGTAGELALPVLLVLGLGGRFAAIGLFILNLVAANSLPDITEAALLGHYFWGSILAFLAIWGPGKWSLERCWCKANCHGAHTPSSYASSDVKKDEGNCDTKKGCSN